MSKELDNLMVLGATSNAGKSLLVTALCRWFAQKGYHTQPFKSQNMSLNAVVTPEGDEIGVAQKAQALAAHQTPSHLHNPILLKPQGGMISQIVVHGQVADKLSAKDYYKQKETFALAAVKSFITLQQQSDIVLLEGAGSPVELNLMDRDIANLFMARQAKAKCLLVVNIEMGGFFASTYGTLALLPKEDRDNIIGVVVNNFRGDPSLFKEGLKDFEKRIGVPIVGVIPHINDLALDVEDSVSIEKFKTPNLEAPYQVRIVRLPHIANFNEFQVFEHCPDIGWSFVDNADDLKEADVVILPGCKTTIKDLQWLKDNGFDKALKAHVDADKKLIGICGGFQMMGKTISDPHGAESDCTQEVEGLGLFNMTTTFGKKKLLNEISCSLTDDKLAQSLAGYELHMGDGQPEDADAWLQLDQRGDSPTDEVGGWRQNKIYGSYIHGLFENQDILKDIFGDGAWLGMHELREKTFDQLAAVIDEHLDMELILRSLK